MAVPRRKKTSRRRGASRGRNRAAPAYLWFIAGLLIGLGLSFFLFIKGYVPDRPRQQPVANTTPPAAEKALAEDATSIAGERNERRYDFFTVLPEMEVIVPEQVLRNDAQPLNARPDNNVGGMYILQAGSFRNRTDAEQMKARLALLGAVANIQVVTVNDATWHRVRIGPVEGARRTDEVRSMLQRNGIETLVLKSSP